MAGHKDLITPHYEGYMRHAQAFIKAEIHESKNVTYSALKLWADQSQTACRKYSLTPILFCYHGEAETSGPTKIKMHKNNKFITNIFSGTNECCI